MAVTSSAPAQPLPLTVVLKEGDTPAGAPGVVTTVDTPTTNGLGQVGFVGVAGSVTFVWFNTGIVWLNSNATTHTLTAGSLDRMGVSNTGGFAYNPLANGLDAIWTHNGLLFIEGNPAPTMTNFPLATLEEPMMLPNGDVWWLGGVDTDADGLTEVEVIYSTPAGMPGSTVAIAAGGTPVGAFIWDDLAFDNTDWVASKNGAHHIINGFNNSALTTDDEILVVDGVVVAQEGQSTGGTDLFTFFDDVSINNSGDYLVAGDTNGATTADEYLAYNGTIAVREGDLVAGTVVTSTVTAVGINNLGHAVFIWTADGFISDVETLYRACDASDIQNTTEVIAFDEQLVDINNDQIADGAISDFVSASPGLYVADDGWLYAEVTIDTGTLDAEAIVRFDIACCGDGNVGGNEACDDAGESATCNADCSAAACGDFSINVTAGEDCDEGASETMFCDIDCTFPLCGDGLLNTTAGEDCDDGGESAACDSDCTVAVCGDGLLNVSAGEACEDGNTNNGDGCSSTCQFEGGQGGGTATGGMGGTSMGGAGGTSMGGTSMGGTSMGGTSMGGTSMGGTSMGGTSMGGTSMGGAGGVTTSTGGETTSGPGSGGMTSGPSATTGTGGSTTPPAEEDGGCGCEVPGGTGDEPWALIGLAMAGFGLSRRRRRS